MCFRAVDELSKGVLTDNTRSFLIELKSRPQPPPMTATTILGTNEEVDYVNNACLSSLPGFATCLEAVDKPYSSKLDRLAPKVLRLKPCAPVVLTTNINVKSGLVNGRTGSVESINKPDGYVTVQFAGIPQPVRVTKFSYLSKHGTREQYPLKLSWARTVHKTQSQSLSGAVHVGCERISQPGQLAVALSRACDSEYLSLSGDVRTPPARADIDAFYSTLFQVCKL